MNIERLREVKDRILANAELFDMGSFSAKRKKVPFSDLLDKGDEERREICGTTCCIAGEGCLLSGAAHITRDGRVVLLSSGASNLHGGWDVEGAKAFGISYRQGQRLFYTGNWPHRFIKKYQKATNKREIAHIAAEVIEDFIKTDGWSGELELWV